MKKMNQFLIALGMLISAFMLQGCYTQLGANNGGGSQYESPRADDDQAETPEPYGADQNSGYQQPAGSEAADQYAVNTRSDSDSDRYDYDYEYEDDRTAGTEYGSGEAYYRGRDPQVVVEKYYYYDDEPAYISYYPVEVYDPYPYISLHIVFGDPYWYFPRIAWYPSYYWHPYPYYGGYYYYHDVWFSGVFWPPLWTVYCPPYYTPYFSPFWDPWYGGGYGGYGHHGGHGGHGGDYQDPFNHNPRDWDRRGIVATNYRPPTNRGGDNGTFAADDRNERPGHFGSATVNQPSQGHRRSGGDIGNTGPVTSSGNRDGDHRRRPVAATNPERDRRSSDSGSGYRKPDRRPRRDLNNSPRRAPERGQRPSTTTPRREGRKVALQPDKDPRQSDSDRRVKKEPRKRFQRYLDNGGSVSKRMRVPEGRGERGKDVQAAEPQRESGAKSGRERRDHREKMVTKTERSNRHYSSPKSAPSRGEVKSSGSSKSSGYRSEGSSGKSSSSGSSYRSKPSRSSGSSSGDRGSVRSSGKSSSGSSDKGSRSSGSRGNTSRSNRR